MAPSLASLIPGVSRNGRLYTAEAIGRAVTRAQQRIDEDGAPLTMLTHHAADDDSTQIVGLDADRINQLEDGSAAYTADLADTDEARKIAALVDTRKGPAFLKGVSIRGAWVGKVRRQTARMVRPSRRPTTSNLTASISPGSRCRRCARRQFHPRGHGAWAELASDGRVPSPSQCRRRW